MKKNSISNIISYISMRMLALCYWLSFLPGSAIKNPLAMQKTMRRKWQPTPVFLPEKFHGQRSLVGYSPWRHKELDTTEHTHTLVRIRSSWFPSSPHLFFLVLIHTQNNIHFVTKGLKMLEEFLWSNISQSFLINHVRLTVSIYTW